MSDESNAVMVNTTTAATADEAWRWFGLTSACS
uniref:Uncharacterized protein n=1 Tax=Amphidinium carterae TaxID=2961 RepID=A7YXI3_AMPCA|nr:unknown [Amphidinium carterae]ABV22113.1 unknown [Amphidinium carterae]ABV22114.1 unknown [Amphidinium carterae]ABV22115.1 unknown [Amphidinium carterae]ABV22116.1 unknown [Amphidinium carterae]